jgi:hypothetical protein
VTADDYRACLKSFGLTPAKKSYDGSTLHVDRDGAFHTIPDAESLDEIERIAFINLLRIRLGILPN